MTKHLFNRRPPSPISLRNILPQALIDNHVAKLIDVADYFIDLGEIADKVRKEASHAHRYDERDLHEHVPAHFMHEHLQMQQEVPEFETAIRVVLESDLGEPTDDFGPAPEFIRVTDDQ